MEAILTECPAMGNERHGDVSSTIQASHVAKLSILFRIASNLGEHVWRMLLIKLFFFVRGKVWVYGLGVSGWMAISIDINLFH